ncbi:MAG: hypothetical protein DIU68_006675 [Chloroflexota bacterium]|nr:MAG: hypothetical protein DIU68_00045 [Chloroflexota bacterium]
MFNSAILEVVLGLIFVYSLLAILVTQINIVISNIFNLRARHLKNAVRELILDPTIQARFLTHPLIALVKRPLDPNRPLSAQGAERVVESGTSSEVTWIAPSVFADVMVDLISAQAAQAENLYAPLLRIGATVLDPVQQAQLQQIVRQIQTQNAGMDALHQFVAALPDASDRQALAQALADLEAKLLEFGAESGPLITLLQGMRNVESPEFQRALDTLLKTARNIEEARLRLETWFDKSMEQVTETYRRLMQYISLGVGLALAILLNVDTLQLARTLWDDPAIRETLVIAADSALTTGELARQIEAATTGLAEATPAPTQVLPDPNDPGGAADFIPDLTPQPAPTLEDQREALLDLGESAATTALTIENLLSLRLPIGWHYTIVEETAPLALGADPLTDTRNLWNYIPTNNPANWLGLFFRKLIGIALTTIAVSQGAPFWFDLMNRIARGGRSS